LRARENIFAGSQKRMARAANRLRFAAKERKFVTVRTTIFVTLTLDVNDVARRRLS
jgi:hypothetical protein